MLIKTILRYHFSLSRLVKVQKSSNTLFARLWGSRLSYIADKNTKWCNPYGWECSSIWWKISSVKSLSHVWLSVTPWTAGSTPGFPVHHQLPELAQSQVHWVCVAIQKSHPLLSPFPPIFNLSQHQGLFKWVSASHQVAKVLELQLQHQSFQWIFRTDFL